MNKTIANLVYFSLIAAVGFLMYLPTIIPATNPGIFITVRLILLAILLYLTLKRKKLSVWIFFSMILGVEVGSDFTAIDYTWYRYNGLYYKIDFHDIAIQFERLGKIFLRLIKTLVAPLIFATLVVGIAGHSNLKQVGRMGLKSIIYFELVTTVALFIGLAAINISKAGIGVNVQPTEQEMKKSEELMKQTKEHKDHLVDIFPENIAKSIHENQVLQIVVFSIIFAIGLSLVKNTVHKDTMLRFCEGLSEVMFKFTDIVMYAAPFAVFGALASTVAKSGLDILVNLLQLVGTLYVALIVFVLVVLLPIALVARINIRKFIKQVTEPVTLAFATASSEAALPKALENMQKFGVPGKIASFVIPTGYSFNLDGTTLYLSLASVFVAQMCGVDLSIGQQITMCLILMLTSKGVAGVRGASFVILATTVASLGLDPQKASIILAIDALMDMARTSVNVLGNCLATAVIARSEGELYTESQLEKA
jgi:proton glutamate symport protein